MRQQAAPVEQAEQEDRAERQEDVGGVELVAEGARVAAGHFPGDLVAGPGLAHETGLRIDDDQRHLLVVGEVADLPVAVDLVDGVGQGPVGPLLLGDVGIAVGDLGRFRGGDFSACRGGRCGQAEQRGGKYGRQPPHSPKWSSTTGATSLRVHCSRSLAELGAAADEEQRAERVAGVQRAVAAAAGVGDAAPVDRLEAGLQREQEVAGVGSAERRPDPGERIGVGLAAQASVLDRRLQRRQVARRPASCRRAGRRPGLRVGS